METRGWELYPVSLPHIVYPLRKALGSSFNFRGETSFPHYQPKEETWKFNLSLTPEGSQMDAQDGEKGHLWRDLEEALRALVHTLTAIHTTLKRWRTVYCHITASLFLCWLLYYNRLLWSAFILRKPVHSTTSPLLNYGRHDHQSWGQMEAQSFIHCVTSSSHFILCSSFISGRQWGERKKTICAHIGRSKNKLISSMLSAHRKYSENFSHLWFYLGKMLKNYFTWPLWGKRLTLSFIDLQLP